MPTKSEDNWDDSLNIVQLSTFFKQLVTENLS